MPTQMGANDISRWCTVWSLLERGTYAIDDCPWQSQTQDKVFKVDPFARAVDGERARQALLLEQAAAPADADRRAALSRSGPPGGPARPRRHEPAHPPVRREGGPGRRRGRRPYVLETPKEPVKWPVVRPLLQAGRRAPERRAAGGLPGPVRPVPRPACARRLGLVPQPLRGRLGDVPPRVRADPEQPHDRGRLRLLRALPVRADLGRGGSAGRPVRRGGVLRRLLRLQRAPRRALRHPAVRDARWPGSRGRRSCGSSRRPRSPARRSWRRSTSPSASSGRSTRSSGRSRTCTRGASGTRRWRWTGSTTIPSRGPSTCST